MGWCPRGWSCWMMKKNPILFFVNQNWVFVERSQIELIESWRGNRCVYYVRKTVSMLRSESSKWSSVSWIEKLTPACVHALCAYNWEYFISHLHSPLVVESNWDSRHMVLPKKIGFSDNNKFQAGRGIPQEVYAISWAKALTVRTTVSGPKRKDSSISSLKTENIMLPYCRLKV